MPRVPITLDPDVLSTPEEIWGSELFQSWFRRLPSEWTVDRVLVRYANRFGGGKIRMIYLQADVRDIDGNPLPGIVFLRGSTVDILTIVTVDGIGKHAVLVQQMRVPVGGVVISNPSGMVEADDTVESGAMRELAEEVGADGIQWTTPVCLNSWLTGSDAPLLVTPGGSDEDAVFFVVEGTITVEQLQELQGRQAGAAGEHERTTVHLVPLDEVPEFLAAGGLPDLKTLASLAFYLLYCQR